MAGEGRKPNIFFRVLRWLFWFVLAFAAALLTVVVLKAALKLFLSPDVAEFLVSMIWYGIVEGIILALPVLVLAVVAAIVWAFRSVRQGIRLGIINVLSIAAFAAVLWGYKAGGKVGVGYLSPYWAWFQSRNTAEDSAMQAVLIYLPDLVISTVGALVWARIYTRRCLGAAPAA